MNIRIDFQVGFVYKGAKGNYTITNIFDGEEEKMISFTVNNGAEQTLKFRTLYHRIRNFMSHNEMTYQGPTNPSSMMQPIEPIQINAAASTQVALPVINTNDEEATSLREQLTAAQDTIVQQREFINLLNTRLQESNQMYQTLIEQNQLTVNALQQQAQTITTLQEQIVNLSGVVGNLTNGLRNTTIPQINERSYVVSNEFCEYNLNTLDEVATMLGETVETIETGLTNNGTFEARGFAVRIA